MKKGNMGRRSKLTLSALRRLMAMVMALAMLVPSNLVTVLSAYAEDIAVEQTRAEEEKAEAERKAAEEKAEAERKAAEEEAARKAAEEEAERKAAEEKAEAERKAAEEEAARKAEEEAAKQAEEQPAQEQPEQQPAEEQPAEQDEQPAEDEPAEQPAEQDEQPAGDESAEQDEQPAEDEPAEQSAEEQPAEQDEQPVEELPAEEATEEPTVEPTEEPLEPLTLTNFSASVTEAFPGDRIDFTFDTTGAERVEFAIYNGSDRVDGGDVSGTAFSWTPSAPGTYMVAVTVLQGGDSITQNVTVTVKPDYSNVRVFFSAVDEDGNGVGGLLDVELARGDYNLAADGPCAVQSEKKYTYVRTRLDGSTVDRLAYSDADRAWLATVNGDTFALTSDAALTVYYKEAFTDRVYEYDDRYIHAVVTLARASAVPDDADLVVTPITGGRSYDAYMTALNDHTEEEYTGDNTLLYDFAFMVNELDPETGLPTGKTVEVKPENNTMTVNVTFKKNQLSDGVGAEDAADVGVVHLPLKDSVLDRVDATVDATNISANDIKAVDEIADSKTDVNLNGSTDDVTFKVNSFSVFAFTVDFHYNGVDYSIPGMSQILLSELIVKLNIMNGDALLNVADVASVEFTDEHLVTVQQVSGLITYNNVENVDVGEKDFLLTSKQPFTSEETLTITLLDGTVIKVGVTDAYDPDFILDYNGVKYYYDEYELTSSRATRRTGIPQR